jgi:hypothetical protein
LAAATGIEFVVAILIVAIIGESKDFVTGDFAGASNEVFGWSTLLIGFGAAAFFWFAATFAARVRQLEGGSGRLAAAVNGSGAILAGLLTLTVGVLFAARSSGSEDLAALATGLLDGPAWYFPAAVFVAAGSIVGVRTDDLPLYSAVLCRLGLGLAAFYIAAGGLSLFNNYAWINETAYVTFLAFVLALSIIGVIRWGEIDSAPGRPQRRGARPPVDEGPAEERRVEERRVERTRRAPTPVLEDEVPTRPARRAPSVSVVEAPTEAIPIAKAKKPAPRKKPAARKPRTPRTPPPTSE